MLTVESFAYNPFSENTYLIYDESKQCIIIDPGCYAAEEKQHLISHIRSNGLIPEMIFLTHTHIDHVLGLAHVKKHFDVPVIGHPMAERGLQTAEMVGKLYGIPVDIPPPIDQVINEGEKLTLGKAELKVLFCPGHAPDHLVLYCREQAFAIVGDVIFNGSIGRTDLPGGNFETLMASIHQKILVLHSETVLYPGHGPETTIKQEITNNPFLK